MNWLIDLYSLYAEYGIRFFLLGGRLAIALGTVKTVPYIAFYDQPQILKIFVEQDALTLP